MKKTFALLIAIVMIASLCAFQVSAAGKVVYVGGDPTLEEKGTGTQDDPFSKLSLAIKALPQGGEIVLLNDIDLGYEYTNDKTKPAPTADTIGNSSDTAFHCRNPFHTGYITIRSESSSDVKNIVFTCHRDYTSWVMGGPTIFKDVKFSFSAIGGYKRIYSNGFPLILDSGTTGEGTYFYPGISPYTTDEDKASRIVTKSDIIFKDGNWNYLFGAQATNCASDLVSNYYVIGKASIVGYASVGPMFGVSFKEANLYVDTTGAVATVHSAYQGKDGTVNIYIRNGSVGTLNCATQSGGTLKAVNVYISGGDVTTALNGKCDVAESTNLFLGKGFKPTATAADFTSTNESTIFYVDGALGHADSGDGSHGNPFAKISQAIKAIGDNDGTVVLLSDVDLAYEMYETPNGSDDTVKTHIFNPKHKGTITILGTSCEAPTNIKMTAHRWYASWNMGGNTICYNIGIFGNCSYYQIFNNGYDLTFDYNCTTAGGATYFYTGNSPYLSDEDTAALDGKYTGGSLTFKAGTWNYIFGPKKTAIAEVSEGETPADNFNEDVSTVNNILGDAVFSGYIELGGMDNVNVNKVTLNCNTAGTIGTLHVGYAGNIKECRLNLLSGTIDKAALGSVSAEGLTCDKMILNLRGGDITTQFDLIDTKPFTFGEAIAYVADGIKYTATAGEGITLKTGNLPATVSLDKTSYKPGQAITVSFTDASAKDWVGIIKKGHTPGETAIDNDMGGKTFGSALMWAYISGEGQVVLTAESEGCLKDLEKIELPVGDYILFYAQNDSYAVTQSIEFKVSNETAPTETGDMTYILIAAIILSAIAAAVVVKKQRS